MGAKCRYICDDVQKNYILGYDMSGKTELLEYLKAYKRHNGTHTFINVKIEAPSFDEVNLILSCISTKDVCTMQNNELRSIVAKFYPDLSVNTQQSIVNALVVIVDELKKNSSLNATLVKNSFVKVLKAIDSTFLDVLKQFDVKKEAHIIYYGEVSKYDLLTFELMIHMGIDVVILSKNTEVQQLTSFMYNKCLGECNDFTYLENILEGDYVDTPVECNTWIKEKDKDTLDNYLENIFKKPLRIEGEGSKFRTAYIGFTGVLNEANYELSLYNFYLANKDNWMLVEEKLSNPTYEEIEHYRNVYRDYGSIEDILNGYYYFIDTVFPKRVSMSFKHLIKGATDSNIAVYAVWLMRICDILFKELAEVNTIPVLVLFGKIDKKFADLLPVIKELPLDIIHFATHKSFEIQEKEIKYYVVGSNNTNIKNYPLAMQKLSQVETLAYNAERELDTILYDGKLMSRFKQFKGINPVILKTTYEEADILWDEPAKFRPSYNVEGEVVTIPTIFMKVNGVGEDKQAFLDSVLKKKNKNTFIINEFPYISRETSHIEGFPDEFGSGMYMDEVSDISWDEIHGDTDDNDMGIFCDLGVDDSVLRLCSLEFDYDGYYEFSKQVIYNNQIDFDKVKKSKYWNYGIYSIETQDLLCERIQNMLTLEWIKKFDKKICYTILTVLLNLDDELVKIIHRFDFTSQVPKVIYFNTENSPCSLEDCILLMFLKSLGFDALVYAPTGYTVIENYIDTSQFTKVELGDYVFDMNKNEVIKTYKPKAKEKKKGFMDILFGK